MFKIANWKWMLYAGICVSGITTTGMAQQPATSAAATEIAATQGSGVRARTLGETCTHSASLFATAPRARSFATGAFSRKDYPVLIYDMKGVLVAMGARQSVADAQAEVDKATDEKKVADKNIDDAAGGDRSTFRKASAEAQATLTAAQEAWDKADKEARKSKGAGQLYWIDPRGFESSASVLTPLNNPTVLSQVYTTEKVLVLVCNATFGDGSDMSELSVVVNGPDMGNTEDLHKLVPRSSSDERTMDRLYVLDPSKVQGNSLTRVLFTLKTTATTDTLATVLLERHKVLHFSAGGGALMTQATPTTFSVATVPSVVTTTTTMASSTTTTGQSASTTTASTTSTATATGTATYVLSQRGTSPQINSVAGVTWYPFGRDTFPVTYRRGFTSVYGAHDTLGSMGIFLGTSVNTLGNFTVAPSYEVFPGIQLFAGATWWSKTVLAPGVTACNGFGSSPSFQTAPASTTTNSSSSTSTASSSTTLTTTTVATSMTTGCANGDKATLFAGANAPTQSTFKPAFAYGILLNSNLLKSFSALTK